MSSTSFVMPNDLSDLCRVCLQLPEESQYLDLSTIYDEEDNLTYGECFTICTQINLSDGEGVPHHLCKSCGLELQMSYDFYKKVEESKRVIEQCQKQLKEQRLNASEQQNKTFCDIEPQHDTDLAIIDKYDAGVPSQEESLLIQRENFISISDVQETNDILNKTCQNKIKERSEEDDDVLKDNVQVGCSQESNAGGDIEEHLDIEDYQNVEALEEEESETIQMKCGENIIPIEIIKYKSCDFEVNEEYVEYTEDDDENEEDVEGNEEEQEEEEEEAEVKSNIHNENKDKHLSWKENVVAVANKEHIPIEIDNGEELYETADFNKNEIETILSESSPDDTIEEDVEDDLNKKSPKKKQSTNKSHATRKRHVGSYACDYCQKVYPNYSRMMSHRRCHEADRPKFTCTYCGRMYATKQAMECHIQTAHEKSGFTCSICNKVFAIRKSLEIHVRYHTGDFPYACNLCDRKFAQACHLNTHINVKHNKIRFSCEYPNCGKFFTSSTSLRNHEFTHGVMPFECEYCQRGYPAKAKLRIHIKRKHGIDLTIEQLENMHDFRIYEEDEFIEEEYEPADSSKEQIIENISIIPCIPPGIRLPLPNGPPFICEFCGHNSLTKGLLSSHRHRKHRVKVTSYECDTCLKQFKAKELYEKHIQRVSCQQYPEFTCKYCSKKFIGSANYKIHLRFHQKVYPFKCDVCHKAFILAVHLKTHIQTKHENKRFICEEPNCGKFFQSKQSLKLHFYKHLGTMPYCCEYCAKKYPTKGRLRSHLKNDHDLDISINDLERMMIAEEISLKAEVKKKSSIKKLKIKKECDFEDDPLFINSTNKQSVETTVANEIPDGIKIENDISNVDNKTLDEIKIESEIFGEYIVSSPNIISDINPPIPMHIVNEKNSPSKRTRSKRGAMGGQTFECEYCGHNLPTKNALYQHRLRKHKRKDSHHRNSQAHKCRLCSKNFSMMASLRLHLETEHSDKGFICEHCGHNLPTKNALYQHRLRKHRSKEMKQKNLTLKLKSIQLDRTETLNSNKKVLENQHSSRKRIIRDMWFECNDCGHKLPTKNALCQHRLRKHRNRQETTKSFRCKYCEIVVNSNKKLQAHLRESHEVLPALKEMVDRL